MEISITPLLITLYLYPGPIDVIKACQALGVDHQVAGCAVSKGNQCDVHVARPQIGYRADFEIIGHEFWHCKFPDFHHGFLPTHERESSALQPSIIESRASRMR